MLKFFHQSKSTQHLVLIDYSIYTAIKISQLLSESRFKDELIYLSENEKNIKIREFALKTLNGYYK